MSQEELAGEFERNRPRLRAVAQRILGTPTEAEDAVQEAWLRLSRGDSAEIGNLAGWLTTVVSRICLDMLRSRATRREDPAEVPELPIAEDAQPESQALVADAIGPALLLVLDTLSPNERLAFVLHDLFAVSFPEIATILDTTPAAARQLASRARRRVQGTDPQDRPEQNLARKQQIVDAFLTASRSGDFAALLALLAPDAEVRADAAAVAMGGGASIATVGARNVAETFSGRARAAVSALLDGEPGAVFRLHRVPKVAFAFTVGPDGLITAIDLLADPQTLAAMAIEVG